MPSKQHEQRKQDLFNHLDHKLSGCIVCEFGEGRDNHAPTHRGSHREPSQQILWPCEQMHSGVDRIIRYLGGGALPAVLETVAVAVHLQDVNVVGEPVKQSAGEPLGAEHVGPLVEGQVGGDQDGAPFVALAEDLEEEFRAGGGQGDEAQLDGQRVEQPSFVPGLQRSALPRFHRRDAPARLPRRCTSPTWHCWTAGPAAWSRSPAALAGNSPVYSHGCKPSLPVAEGAAGNPSCRTFGRILYFRYSSQG